MAYEPLPGDYGVVKTNGFFGWLIRLGTTSRWNHAVIYIGNDEIIEANPHGVEINKLDRHEHIAWNQHEGLTNQQRIQIVKAAYSAVGEPYDFWTIADIALRILGLKLLTVWLLEKLARNKGYICSELVAECYRKAKLPLAHADYLCTPGDLAERLIWQ